MDQDADPPEIGRLRDKRSLWHLAGWGTLAAMALAGAVLITQTDVGAQRLQLAMAPLTGQHGPAIAQADIPPAPSVAPQVVASNDTKKETEALRLETLRLRAELRQLAADRDRLNARVAGLERSLGDMTGSIRRELSLIAATAPKPPTIERPETVTPHTDAVTAGDDKTPPADTSHKQDKSQARIESRAGTQLDAESKSETKTETTEAPLETRPEAKAGQSAKPPARSFAIEAVPLPPVRVASAPAAAQQPGKPELGIDLGGAHSLELLLARWIAVKANFGPFIEGMHPLMVHDNRNGTKVPYRLIVGPLPNGAAAAQLCQKFAASKVTCRTTRFAGEPLTQPQP